MYLKKEKAGGLLLGGERNATEVYKEYMGMQTEQLSVLMVQTLDQTNEQAAKAGDVQYDDFLDKKVGDVILVGGKEGGGDYDVVGKLQYTSPSKSRVVKLFSKPLVLSQLS
jgi:hypothetical protein